MDGLLSHGYGVVVVDCKGSGLGETARGFAIIWLEEVLWTARTTTTTTTSVASTCSFTSESLTPVHHVQDERSGAHDVPRRAVRRTAAVQAAGRCVGS
jgi:hypothetical protein